MTNGPIGDPRPRRGAAPAWIRDGLAVYSLGGGPPLLVMPNPQGMVRVPEAHGPLAERLVGLGLRVITFDPPGAFASPRPPRLGLAEMLACAKEALAVAGWPRRWTWSAIARPPCASWRWRLPSRRWCGA